MPDSLGPSDFFEGVIRALGLEIPAATNVNAPDKENEIVWTRQSDGGLVATIFAFDTGVNDAGGNQIAESTGLRIKAGNAFGNSSDSEVLVSSELLNGGVATQIRLLAAIDGVGGQTGSLLLLAASARDSKTLLDEQGRSDFVTSRKNIIITGLVGELGLRMVRGVINTAGAGSIVKGSGFTIVRNGVGAVTVTFTAPFADIPAVTLTAVVSATNNFVEHGQAVAANSFKAQIVSDAGAASDGVFHFIALGPT